MTWIYTLFVIFGTTMLVLFLFWKAGFTTPWARNISMSEVSELPTTDRARILLAWTNRRRQDLRYFLPSALAALFLSTGVTGSMVVGEYANLNLLVMAAIASVIAVPGVYFAAWVERMQRKELLRRMSAEL